MSMNNDMSNKDKPALTLDLTGEEYGHAPKAVKGSAQTGQAQQSDSTGHAPNSVKGVAPTDKAHPLDASGHAPNDVEGVAPTGKAHSSLDDGDLDIDDLPGEVQDPDEDSLMEFALPSMAQHLTEPSSNIPFVIPQVLLNAVRHKVSEHIADYLSVRNAFSKVEFTKSNGGLIAKRALREARNTLEHLIENEYVSCLTTLFVAHTHNSKESPSESAD